MKKRNVIILVALLLPSLKVFACNQDICISLPDARTQSEKIFSDYRDPISSMLIIEDIRPDLDAIDSITAKVTPEDSRLLVAQESPENLEVVNKALATLDNAFIMGFIGSNRFSKVEETLELASKKKK